MLEEANVVCRPTQKRGPFLIFKKAFQLPFQSCIYAPANSIAAPGQASLKMHWLECRYFL